ncbi:NUDIX domain-containing protein [Paraburkholderia fynbosensis]|uniref:NUDIX domain-containing protein n=1 Tax=Paraburkholderia fynbosensis TaxID=1200993 RepID=UPI00158267CE
MKDRATIVCRRDDKVLLVARTRSRWSLPGGTIKRDESPMEAALRELEEETSLAGTEFVYLFQFGGLSKRHHVFLADIPRDASPQPRNEIARCRWFSPVKISTLVTSIPTREIVDLSFRQKFFINLYPVASAEPLLHVGESSQPPARAAQRGCATGLAHLSKGNL